MVTRLIKRVVVISALFAGVTAAQERGFPAGVNYENCIKPNHISQYEMDSTISDYYFHVKENYVAASVTNPGYYILSGGGTGGAEGLITISEGHGYGMITTALMGGTGPLADPDARGVFDGMYDFYDVHRSLNSPDLMSWQVLTDGNGGESDAADYSATDGDMDIAYSLILAHYQWGSNGRINYLEEAKRIITKGIKDFNFNHENMRSMLGDWVYYWKEGTGEWYWDETVGAWVEDTSGWIMIDEFYWGTRASDWMTGHMHTFRDVTGDLFWDEAADTMYSLIDNFTSTYTPLTGLISDFIDGEAGGPAASNYIDEFPETNQYFENACRVPLRMAADYAHNGSAVAKKTVDKILNWLKPATDNDPSKITWGYNIETGEPLYPNRVSTRFTSPLVTAAIVSPEHQQYLNDGWDFISQRKESYYSDYLNLMSMLLISGNWWAPSVEYNPVGVTSETTAGLNRSLTHRQINKNLQVEFTLPGSANGELALFSLAGKKVASVSAVKEGNRFTATLPTQGLAESVYIMRAGNSSEAISQKIVLR